MKAETQYNDVVGTVAGDFNGFEDFTSFCLDCKLDVEKYKPIGLRFVNSHEKYSIYIQAIDNEGRLVEAETDSSIRDVLNLFKRLNISMYLQPELKRYENADIEETISLKPQKETIVL